MLHSDARRTENGADPSPIAAALAERVGDNVPSNRPRPDMLTSSCF